MSTTFYASAVTYLYEQLPNTAVGGSTNYAGEDNAGKSGNDYHLLSRFDLSSILGVTITAVDFEYNSDFAPTISGSPTHALHRITQSGWDAASATWNKYDGTNSWATAGGDYDSGTKETWSPANSTGWITVTGGANLISLAQDALDNRSGTLDLLWKQDTENGANDAQVRVDNVAGVSRGVRVVITYTGTPIVTYRFPGVALVGNGVGWV